MKNRFITFSFFAGLSTMAVLSFTRTHPQVPPPRQVSQLAHPVIDTVPTPAVLDRVTEKTERLKEKTETIRRNSAVNERQAGRLDMMVDKLKGECGKCGTAMDSPTDASTDAPAIRIEPSQKPAEKKGFFLNRWFRK